MQVDNKINPDTIAKFGNIMKQSSMDVMLDSLSIEEEQRRKSIQLTWLHKKGLD